MSSVLDEADLDTAIKIKDAPHELVLDGSVDDHTHPRDRLTRGNPEWTKDGRMEVIVPLLAREHEVIVAIGNSSPAVIDIESAHRWRGDIMECIPPGATLDVLVAALVRDDTPAELIRKAYHVPEPAIDMLKIFFHGVSNDYGNSVTEVSKIKDVLRATYDLKHRARPLHVKIHTERKYDRDGKRIEMVDREWYAVRHDVGDILAEHGRDIHITIAHVSDARTIEKIMEWRAQGYNVWGEIAAHYLIRCFEDLWEGKGNMGTTFQAMLVCWPLFKREESMLALIEAATSGDEAWNYGSDWACHGHNPLLDKGVKITSDGEVCGGLAILPEVGKSEIIDLFIKQGAAEHLNAFLSGNARKKLGLPPARRKDVYVRRDKVVPKEMVYSSAAGPQPIVLFMGGETIHWQLAA